jgi:DNA repair exonuclease SbcCD ATPase subunit
MATVGNLFVTVGANTNGLRAGLQNAQKQVDQFGKRVASATNRSAIEAFKGWGSIEVPLPAGLMQSLDPGALVAGIGELSQRMRALGKDTSAVVAATQRLSDAQKGLRDASSLRRSMGGIRAAVAGAGFDPDKLRLKAEDVTGLKGGVTEALAKLREGKATLEQNRAAIVEADKATQGLKNAKRALARAQESETKATSALFSAMSKAKSAPEAFAKAQERLRAATDKTRTAQERLTGMEAAVAKGVTARQALAGSEDAVTRARERLKAATDSLAKAQERNAKVEAMRSKVRAAGFDPDKVSALKMPDLQAARDAVAKASEGLTTAKAEQSAVRLAGAIKGVGMAAVAAVASFAALTGATVLMAQKMGALEDEAMSLGMSIESFQRLKTAMQFLGAAPGAMERSIGTMQIQIQSLADGNETTIAAFKRLGMTVGDFDGKTAEQQFNLIIGAIQRLDGQTAKVTALKDIFGKSGLGLRAVVQATAEQMGEAADYASKFVLPARVVKDLAKTDDTIGLVKNGMEGAAALMTHAFAPAVERAAAALLEFLTQDVEAMRQQLGAVATIVAVIADILAVLGNSIRLIFNLLQAVAGIIVGGIVGALGVAVKAVEWIVWGFEKVTGTANDASKAVGEFADTMIETAKEAAKGAGADLGEGLNAGVDAALAATGQSTRAVIDALTRPLGALSDAAPTDQLNLGAKEEASRIKDVAKALEKLQTQLNKEKMGDMGADRAEFVAMQPDAPSLARFDIMQRELQALQDHNAYLEEMKKLEEDATQQLQKMRDEVAALGKTEEQTVVDQIAAVLPHARAEAERLADVLQQAKVSDDVRKHFERLNEDLLKAQMNEEGLARATLSAMGLTGDALEQAVTKTLAIQQQIQSAKDAQAAMDKAKEKREADAESVKDTLASLTKELRQIDMTDAEKVADDLRELGATAGQIAQAQRLQEQISARDTKDKDLPDPTVALDTALGAVKVAMPFDPVVAELSRQEEIQREQLAALTNIHDTLQQRSPVRDMEPQSPARSAAAVDQPVVGMDRCCAEQLSELKAQTVALRSIAANTEGLGKALT